MMTKRELGLFSFFILALIQALSVCGCASTDDSERINQAVMRAQRPEFTSAKCRELARNMRKLLSPDESDYRIGGGDLLDISVYGLERRGEFKTVTVRVEETGEISLPIIPPCMAKGRTVSELEKALHDLMVEVDFIKAPRLSVIVSEFRSKKIAVLGEVKAPGQFILDRNEVSLYEALALAGGATPEAGYKLHVIRGGWAEGDDEGGGPTGGQISGPIVNPARISRNQEETLSEPAASASDERAPALQEGTINNPIAGAEPGDVLTIDLVSLMKDARVDLNVVLRPNDVVFVPEADYFYVYGFVESPGGFAMTRPMRVLDAVALAGGLIPKKASPRVCALRRIEGDQEVVYPIDLIAIVEGEEPNFFLMPEDVVDVRQTQARFWVLEVWDFVKGIFHFSYQLNPYVYDR